MPDRQDLYCRALDRAHALAEQWQGDQTPITRAGAAELLMEVIQLNGWTQADVSPERHLSAVPAPCPAALLPLDDEPVQACTQPAGHPGAHLTARGAEWTDHVTASTR